MTPVRPTVVFLGGAGRSGSTLFERLLGAVPGVATLGEVVHLPSRALVGAETCACGETLSSCPFWGRVGKEAFGGWDEIDGVAWQALQRRVDRNRHLPLLAVPATARFRRDLRAHIDHLDALYRAAAQVSGASVLIDSSKHASTAFALRHLRHVDTVFVHLVRDSRGVAYSWTKEVVRPETVDGGLMPTHTPASAAAWWDAFNVMMEALALTGSPVRRVRYEDVLTAPRDVLRRVLDPIGLDLDEGWDDFLTADGARLGPSHSIAGNPMRFTSGAITLHRDDEWRDRLPRRDRRLVTAITAPLLGAYGYMSHP